MYSTTNKTGLILEPSPLIHRKICNYNEALAQTKYKNSQSQVSKNEILPSLKKQSLVQMFESIGDNTKIKKQLPYGRHSVSINSCKTESQKNIPTLVRSNTVNSTYKQKQNLFHASNSLSLKRNVPTTLFASSLENSEVIPVKKNTCIPKLNGQTSCHETQQCLKNSSTIMKEFPRECEVVSTKSPCLSLISNEKQSSTDVASSLLECNLTKLSHDKKMIEIGNIQHKFILGAKETLSNEEDKQFSLPAYSSNKVICEMDMTEYNNDNLSPSLDSIERKTTNCRFTELDSSMTYQELYTNNLDLWSPLSTLENDKVQNSVSVDKEMFSDKLVKQLGCKPNTSTNESSSESTKSIFKYVLSNLNAKESENFSSKEKQIDNSFVSCDTSILTVMKKNIPDNRSAVFNNYTTDDSVSYDEHSIQVLMNSHLLCPPARDNKDQSTSILNKDVLDELSYDEDKIKILDNFYVPLESESTKDQSEQKTHAFNINLKEKLHQTHLANILNDVSLTSCLSESNDIEVEPSISTYAVTGSVLNRKMRDLDNDYSSSSGSDDGDDDNDDDEVNQKLSVINAPSKHIFDNDSVSKSSVSSSSSSHSSGSEKDRKVSVVNTSFKRDLYSTSNQQDLHDDLTKNEVKKLQENNNSLYESQFVSCQDTFRSKRVSVDSAIETTYRSNFVLYNELPNIPYSKLNVIDWQQEVENGYNSSSSSEDSSNEVRHRKCSVVNRFLNQSAINNMLNGSPKRKQSVMPSFPICFESERADNESGFFDGIELKNELVSEDKDISFRNSSDLSESEFFFNRSRNSSISSNSDETVVENKSSRSYSQDKNDSPSSSTKFTPKRRSGLSGIISLDELSERKMSITKDFLSPLSNESESAFSPKDGYYQKSEILNRRSSTIFMNYNKFQSEGLEVVADKETRDIISDSVETLSTFHYAPYRPVSKYPSSTFGMLQFDEESLDVSDGHNLSSKQLLDYKRLDSSIENEKNTDIANHVKLLKEAVVEKGESGNMDLGISSCSDALVVSEPITKKWEGGEVFFEKNLNPDESKSTTFSTMFGYFNYCLYNFICEEYTKEKWCEIVLYYSSLRKKLELTKNQIWMFKKPNCRLFDDEVTDQVLKTASKVLNINFNLFLQKFGDNYFTFSLKKYGDLLKSIATSLCDFINNIDDIRRHIHKIEKITDEYPPSVYAALDKQGTLMMYYRSNRDQRCLDYFLIGFIKAAARILYGMKTRISLYESRKNTNDYSVISIKAVTSLVNKKNSALNLQFSTRPSDLFMEPFQMDSIFPFHMILDSALNLCQLGASLNRLLERLIPIHGLNVQNYFKLVKPLISFTYESVKSNLNTVFILSSASDIFLDGFKHGLVLKGQISTLDSSNCLWFVGSPKVDLVSQLNGDSNLYLSDIPIHDATREVLLVNERTHEQDNLKTQLEVLTNRLKETSKELALSKINTENILDDIFPKDVAERLMRNLPVPAVTKEEVSILFTDIVGFTSICEKSDPADVTDMLNNLYIGFDLLCEAYEVYKVETIGDAYMAVAGIHQRDIEHGRCTTAMGISMIQRAKKVFTPTGNPVEIRVGIHSGPVVAGVVGTRMPRYCLFGNNVTFANKMESTSESGKLHISPVTYLEIKHYEEFIFFERPREAMPEVMQKKYQGNTYFVIQRRVSQFQPLLGEHTEKRRSFMMPIRRPSEAGFENVYEELRCPSPTESVLSDHDIFPEELRKQLEALELINGYQNGKYLNLPRIGAS